MLSFNQSNVTKEPLTASLQMSYFTLLCIFPVLFTLKERLQKEKKKKKMHGSFINSFIYTSPPFAAQYNQTGQFLLQMVL